MHGKGNGILVVVGGAVGAGKGRGEPVAGTDDGGFGIHVLFLFYSTIRLALALGFRRKRWTDEELT